MEEPRKAGFGGHPPGLPVLFFTELWERFSFYGMRALLILYLSKHFLFSDDEAYVIYGSYTALVYVGPLVGGALADRIMGARRAVTLGAILLALGHFTMALEGRPANAMADPTLGSVVVRSNASVDTLFLALALIVVGSAFLKPNISALVGKLYRPDDPRRDAGFTLFYMGINIGAGVASLLCGYVGETYGWRYGFGMAGVGMLIGLLVFLTGQEKLEGHGEAPDPQRLSRRILGPLSPLTAIYAGAALAVLLSTRLLQASTLLGVGLAGVCALTGLGLAGYAIFRAPPETRDRILVALALMLCAVVFFALFEQAGSSLNLYTDRNVARVVFGFEIPASTLQTLNPFFIIVLAPFFSALWTTLGRRGRALATPMKFALGLAQAGLGFGALVLGALFASADGKVALSFLVLAYFLHTTGELCLSPVGLSAMTKLAPAAMVGFVLGAWFLAWAAAQYLAAVFAKMASVKEAAAAMAPQVTLPLYTELFGTLALLGIGAGVIVALASPLLTRRMHGAD
jgi:POT family proton-dependent oligopeptide transporter